MDNTLRRRYLQAMGIDVWLPRSAEVLLQSPSKCTLPVLAEEDEALGKRQTQRDGLAIFAEASCCAQVSECMRYSLKQACELPVDWLLVMDAWNTSEEDIELLLNEMLFSLRLMREQVVILTVIDDMQSARPDHCHFFLQQQLENIQPKVLLVLGSVAANAVLQTSEDFTQLRGILHKIADIPTVVTYHPAYLVNSVADKRLVWQDLQLAMRAT